MTYPPFPTCLLHLRAKTHSLWPIEGSLFLNQWLSFWAYQWFTLNCTVFSVCITKKTNQLFLVTIISCAIENFKIIKGSRLNKHEKTVWKSPKPVKIRSGSPFHTGRISHSVKRGPWIFGLCEKGTTNL